MILKNKRKHDLGKSDLHVVLLVQLMQSGFLYISIYFQMQNCAKILLINKLIHIYLPK